MEYLLIGVASLSLILWNTQNAEACQSHTLSLGQNHVEAQVRTPKTYQNRTVIIMTPTGGANYLDRSYARSLCRAGFQSIIITGWKGLDEESLELDVHQRLLQRGQDAIQTIVEYLHPEDFIGILGTSVGAIQGLTALGSMDSLSAGFFVAGGAPVAQVIAESSQEELALYREKRFAEFGFNNNQEYAQALAKKIGPSLEPFSYQEALRNKPMGFILAQSDDTVPSPLQQNVIDRLEPQKVLNINAGHFWTIIKAWWFYENVIVDFFLEQAEKDCEFCP